ncbi:MAG: alpha/beta hydrolase fold domain-containing protein [Synechococcus sp.]
MSTIFAGVPVILGSIGLFLSLWIVLPAVTATVLPLTVGAPEISPWLMAGNAIAIAVAASIRTYPFWKASVVVASLAFTLSSFPLVQLPFVAHQLSADLQQIVGEAYFSTTGSSSASANTFSASPALAASRTHPFNILDSLRGIPTADVLHDPDIPFAGPEGIELSLDIYRPARTSSTASSAGPATLNPTLISIYGGAWQRGSSADNAKFNRYMASQGYTVVAIEYRHAPQFRFPAQIDDVWTAMRWINEQAEQYDIDRDRIAVVGRSAGAQLAMLLAYSKQPLTADPLAADTPKIRAVVNFYGPVNLANGYRNPPTPDPIDTRETLETFLGGSPDELPELYRQASPISYVRPDLPPSLLIYGGRDLVVKAEYGRELAQALETAGNTVAWVEIPWADHAFDTIFNGVSSQLSLYYIERFLAWALSS